MTVSGSVNFSVSRNDIIKASLRVLGVLASGEDPTSDQVTDASEALNMLIKGWQGRNIALWLNQTFTLPLAYGGQYYDLGPTGDHAAYDMKETAIATAATAGDGNITVDSDDDITNGDYIGIQLDDGTMQWTTVNGVPAANVVTLTAVLTDDAAVDNVVFNYTTKMDRPLEIIEARFRDKDGGDRPLDIVGRERWATLATKTASGKATMGFFDPQLTNSRLWVWPVCDLVSVRIVGTLRRPVYDFDAIANTPEFPQEWFRALKFGLAVDMATEYSVDDSTYVKIKALSDEAFLDCYLFDREPGSVYFQPVTKGY